VLGQQIDCTQQVQLFHSFLWKPRMQISNLVSPVASPASCACLSANAPYKGAQPIYSASSVLLCFWLTACGGASGSASIDTRTTVDINQPAVISSAASDIATTGSEGLARDTHCAR
jgi:hypothetical protein